MIDVPAPDRCGGQRAAAAWQPWLVALALAGLVAAVYGSAGGLGFVNFDDPRYVFQNPHVAGGLSGEGLAWAFTTYHAGNWHPLTWLSHMLDVELFGMDPGAHHLVNAVLHGIATLLLFGALRSATGRTWPSALAAALFGVHPLHVESVAWISERKDVLCAVFWFLATWAYFGWARRPSPIRYAGVAGAFALALLSKPMAVTLPVVLLLLDVWPLGRLPAVRPAGRTALALLREKAPLVLMSGASAALTLVAQVRGGALTSGELDAAARIGNALLSCGLYLWKAVWPTRLAAVYPHPAFTAAGLSPWKVAVSALFLVAASALVLWQRERRPFLLVGWLWYAVTLLPVIGLVQAGTQGMADRYTYLPLVGIFVALAWLAAELAGGVPWRRVAVAAACVAALLASSAVARRQAETWKDSFALFGHALSVTGDNWMALRNLGVAHQDAGRPAEAAALLEESLRLWPRDAQTWMNLGIAYASARRLDDAEACLRRAVEMQPGDGHAWYNLGILRAMRGEWDALPEIERSLRALDPDLAERLARRAARARPDRGGPAPGQ